MLVEPLGEPRVVRLTVRSGPLFKSAEISSDGITVTFDQAGGLKVQVWRNRDVAIAGADGKFVWANAQIENELVIVWHDKIAKSKAVHYAYARNPKGNLVNGTGIPASLLAHRVAVHPRLECPRYSRLHRPAHE